MSNNECNIYVENSNNNDMFNHNEYQYQSRYIDIFGSNMHYIDVGVGQNLLFVHGTPSWSFIWRNIIKNIKNIARCIAVDMIGHGGSGFPDIEYDQHMQFKYLCEFIKKMRLDNLIIVGHSYGANMAIWYARTHRDNTVAIAYLEPMLGEFKKWDHFNPYNSHVRDSLKKMCDPDDSYQLIVKQNELIKGFSKSTITELPNDIIKLYLAPFIDEKRRVVLLNGGPRNLPIENQVPKYCSIVNDNFTWMKKGQIPQLFLYTYPAAFFTRDQAEHFIMYTERVTGAFLGEGCYLHTEDYPQEISSHLESWLLSLDI